jgi:predicted porin
VNQLDDDNGNRSGSGTTDGRLLFLRHSYMYLSNKNYGEVRWGLTSMAKDDIVKGTDVTDLEDTMWSDNHMNRGFFLRPKGFNTEVGGSGQLKWRDISRCYSGSDAFDCSTRRNAVTYWSPAFFGSGEGKGFTASWGWGEDDIWSAALRYKDDWFNKTFTVGAGAAYENFRDEKSRARVAVSTASRPTSTSGRAMPLSSTTRPACSSSRLGARRARAIPTVSTPASSMARTRTK